MLKVRWVVGGVIMAFTTAGCGDSPPESGTVEYKASNSPEIEAFSKRMSENAKSGVHSKKPTEAASKSGEAKPGSDAKSATKKE